MRIEDYIPVFMLDECEPFEITAIGYTIFNKTQRSISFPKRVLSVNPKETCIEYAIWFDYDIQHLYELEHVWVYIDEAGSVIRVEGSFHGKFLNMVSIDSGEAVLEAKTHPVVYMQPGKHAVLPDPRLVKLVPDWYGSCNEHAGVDGVLIQDMYSEYISADEDLQEKVRKYIKEKYGFIPSLKFKAFRPPVSMLMTWEELDKSIPERVNKELDIIKKVQ